MNGKGSRFYCFYIKRKKIKNDAYPITQGMYWVKVVCLICRENMFIVVSTHTCEFKTWKELPLHFFFHHLQIQCVPQCCRRVEYNFLH